MGTTGRDGTAHSQYVIRYAWQARKISKVVLAKVAERVKSAKTAGHGEVGQ